MTCNVSSRMLSRTELTNYTVREEFYVRQNDTSEEKDINIGL